MTPNDSIVESTALHLLLTGDIGGTNTRLALYERDQGRHSSFGSRYHQPLFRKEYLNEDHLGNYNSYDHNDANGSEPIHESNSTSSTSSNININIDSTKRFVRTVVEPFLEEAWKSDAAFYKIGRNDREIILVCCLGIAGPVDTSLNNGTVITSQREYLKGLTGTGIADECQARGTLIGTTTLTHSLLSNVKACVIINDFVAQGYGCLSLGMDSGELKQLNGDSGHSSDTNNHEILGPKICVGAGTGFGSCYMVPTRTMYNPSHPTDTEYLCFPSEYGQSDWAPNTAICTPSSRGDKEDDQIKFWKYIKQQHQQQSVNLRETGGGTNHRHTSAEHVVSGIGLATAYECFSGLFPERAKLSVRQKFESAKDLRGKVVGEHASECEVCQRAVETVLCAYGSVVGSCAMAFLPTGGLYVTGGLILNLLKNKERSDRNTCSGSGTKGNRDNASPSLSTTNLAPSSSSTSLLTLFVDAYRSKGAASFLLNDIPLYLVLAKDTGLRGAAIRAEMELKTFIPATVEQQCR